MLPTLLGILFFTFLIIQFVPGGPVEQLVNKLSGLDSITESSSRQIPIEVLMGYQMNILNNSTNFMDSTSLFWKDF